MVGKTQGWSRGRQSLKTDTWGGEEVGLRAERRRAWLAVAG